jgi:hypothetical protein
MDYRLYPPVETILSLLLLIVYCRLEQLPSKRQIIGPNSSLLVVGDTKYSC